MEMEIVKEELKIPSEYLKLTDGRICATVHRSWLTSLSSLGSLNFIKHERFSAEEIPSLELLGTNWLQIYIKVYEKQNKNAIPLPRGRPSGNSKVHTDLTFAQVLHYVSDTNYRNLWKEAYKKYYSPWTNFDQREQLNINSNTTDAQVMQEILTRMYGCTIVQIDKGKIVSIKPGLETQSHCNLLPVLFAIETSSAFLTLHEQTAQYSLRECVTYSPAALSTYYAKPLFLVYQLLRFSRDLHDLGLVLGEITLSDILLMDNLTIQVLPKLSDNIYLWPDSSPVNTTVTRSKSFSKYELTKDCKTNFGEAGSSDFGANESIEKLCELWIHGVISNFDYLTFLNNLAGRRYGDPSCHHVMPWVTDFSSRYGGNWRDLTKSKFRLNKGDRQLDLTFDSESSEVGHHVSDVLSEITYYVYLSRRYSRSVLCKHVRPLWVPGEYPVSIQRMHDWSPDECIPQFFKDPNVFKSIHEDLPDLGIPAWATSPEDFVEKHREALESLYVSERLHHWIDLTFGYKLSGSAAIKSKNVCLQLVDNHTSLTNSGVVQLFTQPHPQKIVPSPYWSKTPPRLQVTNPNGKTGSKSSGEKVSEDEDHSSGIEEEEIQVTASNTTRSSPLALSRLLSRSRGSLLSTEDASKLDKNIPQTIFLPKDYNPISALIQVETRHSFLNKVSQKIYSPKMTTSDGSTNYKQVVACRRIKEQQILGCLIVEIFMSGKFRATWNMEKISFENRLTMCLNAVKSSPESLPRCVKNTVALLLQVDVIPKTYNTDCIELNARPDFSENSFRYPTVTHMGLPPPSAHQFLQPVLSGGLFPSSKYFQHLFNVVEMIQEYNLLVRKLNFVTYRSDDSESMNKTRIRYLCKISECKVKALARELERLLTNTGIAAEANLQLIVPHIKQIMEEPYSAVLAAWYLFDPITRALGPKETAEIFLIPIIRLYENGSVLDTLSTTDILPTGLLAKFKTMRLYHRSFLLKLMVRLGLRRFLDNFITPLVEAVGGYRDHLMGSSISNIHRSGNLKTCDLSGSCGDGDAILSPLDEDLSVESETNIIGSCTSGSHMSSSANDEEVFTMDAEDPLSPSVSNVSNYNPDFTLELNLNLNDDFSDDTIKRSPLSTVQSPTIPIPKRLDNSASRSVIDFNSISCNVGSKTSSEDVPLGSSCTTSIPEEAFASNTLPVEFESCQNSRTQEEVGEKLRNDKEDVEQVEHSRLFPVECTVSEMSTESVIWLSHRLGPVLTARYLSRNLLRMLTLCYAGRENLSPTIVEDSVSADDGDWTTVSGDVNAAKILECLSAIVGLYGEQIVILQYFAHAAELLLLCKRKLTPNFEGGLVSCLSLVISITSCLSDSTLMDTLHETIVKSILHPSIGILSTTRFTFPNGTVARATLAEKYLQTLYILMLRLGVTMTKTHLAVSIQRFFLTFDKVFYVVNNTAKYISQMSINDDDRRSDILHHAQSTLADSFSPPILEGEEGFDPLRNKALEELKNVFTPDLAHKAYVLFYRFFGDGVLEQILKNNQLIRILCQDYEQTARLTSPVSEDTLNDVFLIENEAADNQELFERETGFGNVAVIGNRIEVQRDNLSPPSQSISEGGNLIRESSSLYLGRQLRGNWLAYWEHEIGRPDKDTTLNIKQIKLQSFNGHTSSIRSVYVLDNENSFMSGSRDKTVKLWSLRSQGDGSTISSCQYTYTGHKKSILGLIFLESLRYAISCDGNIHCWDPFMGSLLGCPESPRPAPVNTLAANPAPSTTVLVATTEITLRVIDCRSFQYVNEMKVSMNPAGLIRCIAVAPSGHWVALGQASGYLTILDIRTGHIIASWKGHDCEVLQLQVLNETTLISSSLDQTIAVWSVIDGKLKFHMKGVTEPVHCLDVYEQQLVTGTTANRIGVHSSIDTNAAYSSSKLRSDAFKGIMTSLTVLPLNRLLLLGADNGIITLLC
ncbi:WD repeat-containing protein 81 isoform X1 [Leptopilina heterotoma]|uniref:WD repeat-containing protein 81 isoform X1 n=1 Tax=Leptopilina heterotoma TaxID=63436 RepID=UPI001CA8C818|nr:WD repeat-containing protein 81 isoform X1 [Leptopilina heterotoma]